MRVLCLDIGDVRIGVAVSDPLGISTNGIETHRTEGQEKDVLYFTEMARSRGCERIVLGLPLNMDGTEGDRAALVRSFGAALEEKSGIPVDYEDERLTTVEAEEMLIEAGLSRQERRKVIDKVAAEIILRSYLNKK
ncbi:MAG TPA: Holliday junction resolvase RuvX [Clostridiales bacterium]|nr:Holliday junction resolvase RuvX [Clostridiales bacterium]HCU56074.1 Holliday junction resolvase RuvX [Clostridiales bacterium]